MIKLRKYCNSDAEQIVSWFKDEYTFRLWSADRYEHYPITAEDMNQYYSQYSDDELCKLTAVEENGELAGHITIRFLDENRKIARLGFVIINDTKRGKGYGKQLVLSAVKYAFDELKADKVTIGVFEQNTTAFRCYLSCGFKPVGTESYTCMGEIWNCIDMEFFRQ